MYTQQKKAPPFFRKIKYIFFSGFECVPQAPKEGLKSPPQAPVCVPGLQGGCEVPSTSLCHHLNLDRHQDQRHRKQATGTELTHPITYIIGWVDWACGPVETQNKL